MALAAAALGVNAMGAAAQAAPELAPGAALSTATAAADARQWQSRHAMLIRRTWGVDVVGVHPVSSGQMLAFKYRIVDPDKARALNERKSKAYLVDEASGTVLAVPAMENVGELRSGTTPQPERIYFMIFGNPGQLVKAGSRVSIVAGAFKVEGLVVQ